MDRISEKSLLAKHGENINLGLRSGLVGFVLVCLAAALHALWWATSWAGTFRHIEGSSFELAEPLYTRGLTLLFEGDLISFGGCGFLLAAFLVISIKLCIKKGLLKALAYVGRRRLKRIAGIAAFGYLLVFVLVSMGFWEP